MASYTIVDTRSISDLLYKLDDVLVVASTWAATTNR